MNKEELIEKYPELLKEIFVEFTNQFFDKQITWNEYLEENKPKIIFTTEDGVEIFQKNIDNHDFIFALHENNTITKNKLGITVFNKNSKLFSTLKAAEKYQLKNAKVLSYNDVMIYLSIECDDNVILDMVKQRLNQK